MAVSYRSQKCNSCASTKLEYDKETKLWHCIYCGAVIERHEEADSLFTIKNVVRQALIDIAYVRMDSARSNLTEAEKIDSKYVGTLVAAIAYEMNMLIHGNLNEAENKNMMAQLKKNYLTLSASGAQPTEEEIALYEFLDSAEAVGVLLLVFDSVGAAERRDALMPFFTPEEVYAQALNSNLVNFSVNTGNFEMFDKIISNTANINIKSVINIVLSQYPDNENKCANIEKLITAGEAFTEEDINTFSSYLETSADGIGVKTGIAKILLARGIGLPMRTLINNVLLQLTDASEIKEMIGLITKKHLLEPEVHALADFAIQNCSVDICCMIFDSFLQSGQYVELTQEHYLALLKRAGSIQDRIRVLNAALQFPVSEKVRNNLTAEYLCGINESAENRLQMLQFLLSAFNNVPTNAIEKYLLNVAFDSENKPAVVKTLFSANLNKSFFRNILSAYLQQSQDSPTVTAEIVDILTGEGFTASPSAIVDVLCKHRFQTDFLITMLRRQKQNGLQYGDIFEPYISTVQQNFYDSAVFYELLSGQTGISDRAIIRYLLVIRDPAAAKAGNTSRMLSLSNTGAQQINCTVAFNNEKVYCNLVQAYLLTTPDDETTALAVYSVLPTDKNILQAEINASGSRKKFKKYLAAARTALRPVSARLCAQAGLL